MNRRLFARWATIAPFVVLLSCRLCFAPNEIEGPEGIGDERLVPFDRDIPYHIYFENFGAAPAQRLLIQVVVDEDLDWGSLRLQDIELGDLVLVPEDPEPRPFRANLSVESVGPNNEWNLEISVVFDLVVGILRWSFTTLDPSTGEPPENPIAGFLPPSDGTGQGGGMVSFSARPKPDLPEGTELKIQATIVFDDQEPIESDTAVHRISHFLPGSPTAPVPVDGASAVPRDTALCWQPAAETDTYDVFLWNAVRPPEPSAFGLVDTCWSPPQPLESATTYSWQVVARNTRGWTTGPIWSFTTSGFDEFDPATLGVIQIAAAQNLQNRLQDLAVRRPGQGDLLPARGRGGVVSIFRRGDPNGDGKCDIRDSVVVLELLFVGSYWHGCLAAADTDDDGQVSITDAVCLLRFVLWNGPPPAEPFDSCGVDPTPGALVCDSYFPCG